jgi:hypothetical protein
MIGRTGNISRRTSGSPCQGNAHGIGYGSARPNGSSVPGRHTLFNASGGIACARFVLYL